MARLLAWFVLGIVCGTSLYFSHRIAFEYGRVVQAKRMNNILLFGTPDPAPDALPLR
jgi:hypothetical protein